MKKKFKKIMSLFLCTVLLSPTSTSVVFADESEIDTVYVNVTYGQTEARSMLDMVNEFRTGDEAWAWNEDNSEKVYYTDLDELGYGLIFFIHREYLALNNIEEAGMMPCMAGRPHELGLHQNSIPITIIIHFHNLLQVPTCSTLIPQLLTAAAPEPGIACFQGHDQGVLIHIGQHDDFLRLGILHYDRHQAVLIKFNFRKI